MLTCANCGTENPADAQFCHNCGAALTQASSETLAPASDEGSSPSTTTMPVSADSAQTALPDSAPLPAVLPAFPPVASQRSPADDSFAVGKAFTFAFEDSQWVSKLGVGAFISLIPILNFAWSGYITDIMRRVSASDPHPLPEWSDFGKKLADGLVVTLAGLIYMLPGLILFFLPFSAIMLPAFAQNPDAQNVLGALGGSAALLFCCLWVVYLLGATFLFPAAHINYARANTFGSFFQASQISQLATSNLSHYSTAWLVTIVANVVVYGAVSLVATVLNIIPCIGCLLTVCLIPFAALAGAWLAAMYAHLFGQVGRVETVQMEVVSSTQR